MKIVAALLAVSASFATLFPRASGESIGSISVDPTNGDMAIVSGAGKNILVNNVNIIAELERRKSEADSVQTALDEYKQQSVKDHEVLESKFNQAEEARKKAEEANRVLQAAAAQAEQVRAADIADLTARLKAAEDAAKEQDPTVASLVDQMKVLVKQLYKPALTPAGGSLAADMLQGEKIAVSFKVAQGDITEPACSEPGGVLKAAGLDIAAGGTPGQWECAITGTLPALSAGEETLTFDATATDSLKQSTTGAYTIHYIANTAPSWKDASNYAAKLYSRVTGNANNAGMTALATLAQDGQQEAADLTFTLCGGALPKGLGLNADGTFAGEAKAHDEKTEYKGKFCVSDGIADDKPSKAFVITVETTQQVRFYYKGKDQTWTVPAGVTAAKVSMWGAGGGRQGGGSPGGGAGYTTGTMTIPPNTASYVIVCGVSYGHGTYNNANSYGYGGAGYRKGGGSAANGGGMSGIFIGSAKMTFDKTGQNRAVAIAGGGGGGGYNGNSYGGYGGGSKGGDGIGWAPSGCRATGGSQSAEWAHENGNHGGVAAKAMLGGVTSTDGNTGGGGGGYYGGATQSCSHNAGGGGGSGYVGGSGAHKFSGSMQNGGAGGSDDHYPGGTDDPLWSVNWPIGKTGREGNVVITF